MGVEGDGSLHKTEGERDDFSTLSLSVVPTLAEAFSLKALKEKALKEKTLEKKRLKKKL